MLQANNLWEADQLRKITTVPACDDKIALLGEYVGRSGSTAEADGWHDKIVFLKKIRAQLIGGRGL